MQPNNHHNHNHNHNQVVPLSPIHHNNLSHQKMFKLLTKINLKRLCSRLGWGRSHANSKPKIVVKRLGDATLSNNKLPHSPNRAAVHPNHQVKKPRPVRVATFNAALFSMAPAVVVPKQSHQQSQQQSSNINLRAKSLTDRPKSILKQSPMHPNSGATSESLHQKQQRFAKSKLRVSINLPDNEISLGRSRRFHGNGDDHHEVAKTPLRSLSERRHTVVDVLRELDADILALQDVKAEEEREMSPLSDLANALGMHYVFAESWAPEYGNAVLSKWPIKRWKVQKIFDDTDFRNVLKTTIEVPDVGEVNFYCTHLDHLDENWRMKQINAIIDSNDAPHILAGGLNSLDESDYSGERWTDIVKYYEDMGKPTPKTEVTRFLKAKQYTDAKAFAGECESVVMIAKGQSVQGTCKYGTRVDYILASPGLQYKYVPGSYSVVSSKGTSDHHIVTVDIQKVDSIQEIATKKRHQPKQRVVRITSDSPARGLWSTDMNHMR